VSIRGSTSAITLGSNLDLKDHSKCEHWKGTRADDVGEGIHFSEDGEFAIP